MARLAVIGCGYVGTVTAACFARLGHTVHCIDLDAARIARLRQGDSPIYEPGLEPLLREGIANGRLSFASEYPAELALNAETIFIAVNTPASSAGAADLRAVRDAVASVARCALPGAILVNKSTVPIGTGELVDGIAARTSKRYFPVVSNPEFLREGSAVADFMNPDRVVLGSDDQVALARVAALYEPLGAPIQRVGIRTAEMVKYASNAFLATKISFINEIAAVCDALGADVLEVARGMGLDHRIGTKFLAPGLGWGGSCLPKDVEALAHTAAVHGAHPQLLRSVIGINHEQRLRVLAKVREGLGTLEASHVLVLGAAFKPNTDDIRNSPALEVAQLLHLEGASVSIYDPVVPAAQIAGAAPFATIAPSLLEGAAGASAIVLATEWAEFKALPFGALREVMTGRLIVDGRHLLDPEEVKREGFSYRCIGRPDAEGGAAPSGAHDAVASEAALGVLA